MAGERSGYERLEESGLQFFLGNSDDTWKTGEVEGNTKVSNVCAELAEKFKIQDKERPDWVIVEHLVDLNLERTLEDHELVMEVYESWGTTFQPHTNVFRYRKDLERYEYMNNTADFFPITLAVAEMNNRLARASDVAQRSAIRTILNETELAPIIFGEMRRKQLGKEDWDLEYFVLRNDHLYHSNHVPEDPVDTDDMEPLAEIKHYNFYPVIEGKRIFDAGWDSYFCLKHEIPGEDGREQFHYFSCKTDEVRLRWITAMRIKKTSHKIFMDLALHKEITDPVSMQRTAIKNRTIISGGVLWATPLEIQTSLPWFFPKLSYQRAEELLKNSINKNGVFLVHGVTHGYCADFGPFALVCTYDKKIIHYSIIEVDYTEHVVNVVDPSMKKRRHGKAYQIMTDDAKFYDLIQLVEFHQLNRRKLATELMYYVGPQSTALLDVARRKK